MIAFYSSVSAVAEANAVPANASQGLGQRDYAPADPGGNSHTLLQKMVRCQASALSRNQPRQ